MSFAFYSLIWSAFVIWLRPINLLTHVHQFRQSKYVTVDVWVVTVRNEFYLGAGSHLGWRHSPRWQEEEFTRNSSSHYLEKKRWRQPCSSLFHPIFYLPHCFLRSTHTRKHTHTARLTHTYYISTRTCRQNRFTYSEKGRAARQGPSIIHTPESIDFSV